MWPFSRSKIVSGRREILRPLSPYLTQEMIEKLARTPDALLPKLQQAMIPYVILQVRDDDLGKVSGYLDQASEAVMDAGGVVMSVMSSVIVVVFGIPVRIPDDESIAQRDQAVARLRSDLRPNVRAIFGRADGLYGNMGTRRMNYGALIPDFSRSLESLLKLEFGELAEV